MSILSNKFDTMLFSEKEAPPNTLRSTNQNPAFKSPIPGDCTFIVKRNKARERQMRHFSTSLLHCRALRGWPPVCLVAHGPAVNWILVGGDQLVHIDSNGGQRAVQILQGLFRQGGPPAHDPGKLHVQHAEVGAAVHQGVVVVVGGQHPVRSRGRVCRFVGTRHSTKPADSKRPSLTIRNGITKSYSQRRWPAAWRVQMGPWTWQSHWWRWWCHRHCTRRH